MGIDIYAKWRDQTKEEKEDQCTGFSTVSGDVGYLREAYHGSPYVTKYLLTEAFEAENCEAQIDAETLEERLPVAVLMALYREKTIYEGKESPVLEFSELMPALNEIFANQVDNTDHELIASLIKDKDILELAKTMIKERSLPDYALAFVDFVALCKKKEEEQGEPCTVYASY